MKKIMAIMTFLSVFFMMNLPVLADIPVDDSEYVRNETSYLPIVLSISIIVIVAAVVLAIFLRRSRAK